MPLGVVAVISQVPLFFAKTSPPKYLAIFSSLDSQVILSFISSGVVYISNGAVSPIGNVISVSESFIV